MAILRVTRSKREVSKTIGFIHFRKGECPMLRLNLRGTGNHLSASGTILYERIFNEVCESLLKNGFRIGNFPRATGSVTRARNYKRKKSL